MKEKISSQQAEQMLLQKLDSLDKETIAKKVKELFLPDLIYEYAMETAHKYIDEINSKYDVFDDMTDDGDLSWFDKARYDFAIQFFAL